MGKKKSWFTYVKRLFISESKSKPKSEKKWKNSRSLFKFKNYPAIEASERTIPNAAAEEQQKRAIAVANAAAAAAKAAVAAATAAARLANFSRELRRKNLHAAATRIQTCYRRYLARKALSALKGVVRLQAVVRGELARRTLIVQEKQKIPNSKKTTKLAQLKLRGAIKLQAKTEGFRRSFCHAKQKSTRDDDDDDDDDPSSHSTHSFRAYMATTESAKAKQRRRLSESSCSCQDSPSKLSISSFNSELIFNLKPS